MSDTNPTPNSAVPPEVESGETVAEKYLQNEAARERRSLRMTQIFGGLGVLATLIYMTFLNSTLARSLEPKAAAEIARGIISERVEENANEIASQFKTRVPQMVADVPDYALKQIPIYREQLEEQVEQDLNRYLTENTAELDSLMDEVLVEYKDQIKTVLEGSKDPETVKQLASSMETALLNKLAETQVNGESLQSKIGQTLDALLKIEARMNRLAEGKNLTPQEMKARRAIAILSHSIHEKTSATASTL